jgi:TRAP-type C4-dicarboxylate transport system permease small subunit
MIALAKATDCVDAWLGRLCRGIVVLTMLALLAVIGANVVARYLFESGGINEVGEIPELLFPWLIAAGIVLGVQRSAHIAVDFYSGKLGPRGKVAAIVFVNMVVFATYALLIGPVVEIAGITADEHTPLLRLPRSIGFYSLLFGMAGTMWASLAIAVRVVAHGAEAAPEFDPEESVT